MIISTLENQKVKVNVSNQGAELYNLIAKENSLEYIWQKDVTYWPWHAPICFPITGRVHDDTYTFEGKQYHLTVHGFARESEFSLIESSDEQLTYELTYSDKTLKVYPFKFSLRLIYTLLANGVKVSYIVKNLDEKKLFFNIGLHTAYNCPILNTENFQDYEIIFSKRETADRYFLENGIDAGKTEPMLQNENTIALSKELFSRDILLFKNLKSKSLKIKSKKSDVAVKISYNNFANVGIWTKPQGAPFVCIEPWNGWADVKDKYVDFDQKEGICTLDVGKTFECSYQIEF